MKKAQSLVEYTLILVMISLIAITTLNFLGKRLSFRNVSDEVEEQQNIVETMTSYCKLKGLVYNTETEKCEKSDIEQEN